MKKIYFLIFGSLMMVQIQAQELVAETGMSFTSFDFTNSQGGTLDNLLPTTNNYLAMGYRQGIFKETLHLYGGMSLNKYGAIGSDNNVGNYFEWETSYLGLNLFVDVKAFEVNKFSFYVRGGTSAEFMLQGRQTLNHQVFDLNGVEEFDGTTFFFRGGIILQYQISETLSIFSQYKYGKSNSNGNGESLKYISHEIGVGIVVHLKNSENSKTNPLEEENTEL